MAASSEEADSQARPRFLQRAHLRVPDQSGAVGKTVDRNLRFGVFALHPSLCAGGTGLCHAARRGDRIKASALVAVVILVIRAVTLEEVGSREAFGADLAQVLVRARQVSEGNAHHR